MITRRPVGGARYESANSLYQQNLEKIYADWAKQTAAVLEKAKEQRERETVIVAAVAALSQSLVREGAIGLLAGMQLGAAGQPLVAGSFERLAQLVRRNATAVTTSLAPALQNKLLTATYDADVMLGGAEALEATLKTMQARVGSYAGAHWEATMMGIGEAVAQYPDGDQRAVQIELDPAAQHCEECPKLARVYRNWNEMMNLSGIPASPGRSRCGANCRCVVKIETAPGSGRFVRL